MTTINFKGNPLETVGSLPEVGAASPDFDLVAGDLSSKSLSDFAGQKLVLNIVPSIDTGICAMSARRFNEEASSLDGTKILTISLDLPFAQGRFCGAEGLEDVVMLSGFRGSAFGEDYGVTMKGGPLAGLYSRAVVVLNAEHEVTYTEQVPEITQEPDYDAALDAIKSA